MRNWHKWLKENLRPDQLERLDAYDVQILASIDSKHRPMIEVESIYRDVHREMGGITEEQIYERLKKLSDMAVVRVYACFNRDMEAN